MLNTIYKSVLLQKIFVKEGAIKTIIKWRLEALLVLKGAFWDLLICKLNIRGDIVFVCKNNMSSSRLLEKENVDLIKTASFAFPHKCGTCSEPINCLMMLLRSLWYGDCNDH